MCLYDIAAICTAKNLNCQYVIHVHSPSASDGGDAAEKLLFTAITNVMKLTEEKRLKTIALPCLSDAE